MPHQCVRCGTFYGDGAQEILKGCSCGSRLFFFVKKSALEKAKKVQETLTVEDKQQIENDVLGFVGEKEEKEVDDSPVVLDFESISVLQPGKFELDLVHLFNKNHPLVYKLEEGKYIIDIPETFTRDRESE
jgi:predicted  nucleic acid-binding Zn-ribbon protein